MFQVTEREKGKCFFGCTGDVATLTKDGQPIKLCRTHLWQALGNGEKKAKEKPEQK